MHINIADALLSVSSTWFITNLEVCLPCVLWSASTRLKYAVLTHISPASWHRKKRRLSSRTKPAPNPGTEQQSMVLIANIAYWHPSIRRLRAFLLWQLTCNDTYQLQLHTAVQYSSLLRDLKKPISLDSQVKPQTFARRGIQLRHCRGVANFLSFCAILTSFSGWSVPSQNKDLDP